MLTRPDPTRQNPAKSWPDPTRPDPTRGSIRPVDNSGWYPTCRCLNPTWKSTCHWRLSGRRWRFHSTLFQHSIGIYSSHSPRWNSNIWSSTESDSWPGNNPHGPSSNRHLRWCWRAYRGRARRHSDQSSCRIHSCRCPRCSSSWCCWIFAWRASEWCCICTELLIKHIKVLINVYIYVCSSIEIS